LQKSKIIFVTPALSSFASNDISILSKKYKVIVNKYAWKRKILIPFYLLHQFFFVLWYMASVKKIIISFGGYWSLIPSFFGKLAGIPVFIILHGTDCASIPQINYGSLRKPLVKVACKLSYIFATKLLPVSISLIEIKNTFYPTDKISEQGFKFFFPKLKTDYEVVPNGLDENFWKPISGHEKEQQSFISVFSGEQFFLKGGDLILDIAKRFPNCKFYLAGLEKPNLNIEIANNVVFLGKLSKYELRDYYNKSRFHFQLSIFEGFGISLCEAMLCECIPIGSSVNNISDIIGNTGYILEKRDIDLLEIIVLKALSLKNKSKMGENARNHIAKNYYLDKREKRLLSL